MSKRIRVLLFFMSMLACGHAFGSTEDLARALPDACYHSGKFRQSKTVDGVDAPLISSGSYVFNCNKGLIWHIQMPIIETTVYTVRGKPTRVSEQGQVSQLDSRLQRALGEILNNIIGGNRRYIDKHFVIATTTSGYSLTPKNRRIRKSLNTVLLDNRNDRERLTLVQSDTETTVIDIYEHHAHDKLSESSCAALRTVPTQSCLLLEK